MGRFWRVGDPAQHREDVSPGGLARANRAARFGKSKSRFSEAYVALIEAGLNYYPGQK